jgi:MFS family permease
MSASTPFMTAESGAAGASPDAVVPRQAGFAQGSIIVVAGFLPIMAIVSLAPAIPRIMGHFGGLKNASTLIPLMVTAPGLVIALVSPAMGWLIDRFGRRPVCLLATLVYGLLGMAPLLFQTLPEIFATRLGLGVCEAGILTAVNTLLGDYYTPAQRSFWLTAQGVFGTIFGTALIIACGAVTAIMWNGAFFVYALALPIFIAMIFFIYEPLHVAKGRRDPALVDVSPFPWRDVAVFASVTLFAAVLYYVGIVQMGLAFSAVGVASPQKLGWMISIASIGVPIGTLIFGALSQRLSTAQLIAMFLTLFGAGLIGVGLAHSIEVALPLAMLQQVGAGMCIPTLILWATKTLSVRHRGRGMGIWTSAFFLGQFVSPLAVGLARGASGGILGAFIIMGGVAVAGAVIASAGQVWLRRRTA